MSRCAVLSNAAVRSCGSFAAWLSIFGALAHRLAVSMSANRRCRRWISREVLLARSSPRRRAGKDRRNAFRLGLMLTPSRARRALPAAHPHQLTTTSLWGPADRPAGRVASSPASTSRGAKSTPRAGHSWRMEATKNSGSIIAHIHGQTFFRSLVKHSVRTCRPHTPLSSACTSSTRTSPQAFDMRMIEGNSGVSAPHLRDRRHIVPTLNRSVVRDVLR